MTRPYRSASGFSLIELMVATALLMMIMGSVTGALVQLTNSQRTINNRTAMHSGVRGATELLQQEVGQAGRIALPDADGASPLQLSAAVAADFCGAVAVTDPAAAGLFAGITLVTRDGDESEAITVTAVGAGSPRTITACFTNAHTANTVLEPLGGFANGVLPTNLANGSTANVLKIFGDINADGSMVYVEYTCDQTVNHNLYRNVVAWDDPGPMPAATEANVLLRNVIENPDDDDGNPIPCFAYQESTITINGVDVTFVLDVAVTLTVETEQIDPITRRRQTQTKALLNVSPRNVFNTWSFAGMSYEDHVQITPQPILDLIEPVVTP